MGLFLPVNTAVTASPAGCLHCHMLQLCQHLPLNSHNNAPQLTPLHPHLGAGQGEVH
jgi:hypothetical protein